jgi:tRNA (cmo5U34)-methyltransferase
MSFTRTHHQPPRSQSASANAYWASAEHALRYIAQADSLPHRREAEEVLLDHVPARSRRVLDLGTGDGRLIALLQQRQPAARCIGLDFSEPMLVAAHNRFARDERVGLVRHDLASRLPRLGEFDAVISSLATHNLQPERQRTLYEDVFEQLAPGGVFCNLEHVSSPTPRLHDAFYREIAHMTEFDHRSHEPLSLATHLQWLRELEFDDVDCYWKWLEVALIVGVRPG